MKILLVGNYGPDRQYSMLGFFECLLRELPKAAVEVSGIAPSLRLHRPGRFGKWLGYADKFLLFKRELVTAASKVDVVHILDHSNGLYVPWLDPTKTLVTCHDLLAVRASLGEFPGWRVRGTGRKLQSRILEGLRRCRHMACVSEATLSDARRLLGPGISLRLLYNGFYQELPSLLEREVDDLAQSLSLARPFMLHVGGDSPYKNRAGAVRLFGRYIQSTGEDMQLVLAGRKPSGETAEELEKLPREAWRHLADPDSSTLACLYRTCVGLLFPSFAEGFGLPILEAQKLGCLVFTSNRKPMTEVCAYPEFAFDPCDLAEGVRQMSRTLNERESLVSRGLRHVEGFTAARMATNYKATYLEIAGG